MPPRGPLRIRLEASTAPGIREPRHVVYLHVNGYRFELTAPSPSNAMDIVIQLALALGLEEGE